MEPSSTDVVAGNGDWSDWIIASLASVDYLALTIAVLTPVLILVGRFEIRLRRARQILDFEQTFKSIGGDGKNNPSFEFVRSKYFSELDIKQQGADDDDGPPFNHAIRMINKIRRRPLKGDMPLLLSAAGMVILIYFGFEALHAAVRCGFESVACGCSRAFQTTCAKADETPAVPLLYGKLVVVAALAFLGAYVAAIRIFLRSLAVFDLSAFTFLRQTAEMIASVLFVIVAFSAFPDPFTQIGTALADTKPEPAGGKIPWIWFALAPVLGLMPQSATKFVLTKTRNLMPWTKSNDDRFNEVTHITALDAIDGIDFETRFRLEECGIYDVQNLAAYNPIMLHIESPYGIYQCIDWVAQAQLCHILGLEKFLMMRELNIRTIFDLERAIDSSEGPNEFDIIYAGILFAPTGNLRSIARLSQSSLMITRDGKATTVSVEAFCTWARDTMGTEPAGVKTCVEHIMLWIGDDLHVRRLRRVWNEISEALGDKSVRLPDSTDRGATSSPLPTGS